MTTYAIGDIQGCYHAFQALLARIAFNPKTDQLWLVGDLVNRGSGSLEVLRWCVAHQNCLKVVLGNHDLHTLVVAAGFVKAKRGDTLEALLLAEDASVLLDWLRHQHLAYQQDDYLMVHAGLLPQWSAPVSYTHLDVYKRQVLNIHPMTLIGMAFLKLNKNLSVTDLSQQISSEIRDIAKLNGDIE